MAQRIQTLCDEHQTRQEDADGETWTIQVIPPHGKAQAYDVDLCADCGKPVAMALEHLAEIGRKAGKPPALVTSRPVTPRTNDDGTSTPTRGQWQGVGDVACPICGTRPSSDNALRNHLQKQHDTSYASAFDLSEEDAPYTCPECGLRYEIPQAMGAHRRARHGVVSGRAQAAG